MLPLILRPALEQLGGLTFGTPDFTRWRDLMFYVPAVCGGIFGLLGGYLTDRLGRRRILTWSILLYALSALAPVCDVASDAARVEDDYFRRRVRGVRGRGRVAGRLFPEPKQRETILGYTQAFSSLGGFMVSLMALAIADRTLASGDSRGHDNWRYLLISD